MNVAKKLFPAILVLFAASTLAVAQHQTNPAGTVSYTHVVDTTGPCSSPGPGFDYQYSGWEFTDASGGVHTFVGTSTAIGGKLCKNFPNPAEVTGFTATSSDGLYVITVTGSTGVVTGGLVQGYIDPKYVILSVIYAPPGNIAGASGPSNVSYATTNSSSQTTSLSQSVGGSSAMTVSVSSGFSIPFVGGGAIKQTYSNTYGQTTTTSSGVTLTRQTTDTSTYYGTPSFDPASVQAHDYDQVVLWLNPALIFSINPSNSATFQWNGYGVDQNDPAGAMDIVKVYVGQLNGDFVIDPSLQTLLSRSWAAGQTYATGVSAALSQADFNQILAVDPFAQIPGQPTNSYSLGYPAPSTSNGGRYTQSSSSGGDVETFDYPQGAPGGDPDTETHQAGYSQMTTQGLGVQTTNMVSSGVDVSFQGSGFLSSLSADLNNVYTLTTSNTANTSLSNTSGTTATAYIVGPPCQSTTSPCVPQYSGPGEFDIYQDNVYGTFMFYPIP